MRVIVVFLCLLTSCVSARRVSGFLMLDLPHSGTRIGQIMLSDSPQTFMPQPTDMDQVLADSVDELSQEETKQVGLMLAAKLLDASAASEERVVVKLSRLRERYVKNYASVPARSEKCTYVLSELVADVQEIMCTTKAAEQVKMRLGEIGVNVSSGDMEGAEGDYIRLTGGLSLVVGVKPVTVTVDDDLAERWTAELAPAKSQVFRLGDYIVTMDAAEDGALNCAVARIRERYPVRVPAGLSSFDQFVYSYLFDGGMCVVLLCGDGVMVVPGVGVSGVFTIRKLVFRMSAVGM